MHVLIVRCQICTAMPIQLYFVFQIIQTAKLGDFQSFLTSELIILLLQLGFPLFTKYFLLLCSVFLNLDHLNPPAYGYMKRQKTDNDIFFSNTIYIYI